MIFRFDLRVAALLMAGALASCASSVEVEQGLEPRCLPGRQLSCECAPPALEGVHVCEADGRTWSACECYQGGAT